MSRAIGLINPMQNTDDIIVLSGKGLERRGTQPACAPGHEGPTLRHELPGRDSSFIAQAQ